MKKEELIKKLESTELPKIELQSHRSRLRIALLDADYPERQREVAILDLTKSKVRGGIERMLKGLVSPRPVWKTALVTTSAIVLAFGLAIGLPSLIGQSPEVLAAEIAQNSPDVIAALGGDEVETVKVLNIKDNMATVVVEGKMGGIVNALVDLYTKVVTQAVSGPQLTDEEKEKALNIVTADPRVQELLDRGAVIDLVLPMYVTFSGVNQETGEIEEITETWAQIWINLGNRQWGVQVDLIRDKVVSITD
jgi:hypothetical protein